MEGEDVEAERAPAPLEIKTIARMLLSYRPQPTKSCAAWPRNISEGNVLVILCNRQPCCTKFSYACLASRCGNDDPGTPFRSDPHFQELLNEYGGKS
jgi:hypothetical protein